MMGIESGDRLVDEERRRLDGQRPGQKNARRLSAGQRACPASGEGEKIGLLKSAIDRLFAAGRQRPKPGMMGVTTQRDHLSDGKPPFDAAVLRQISEPAGAFAQIGSGERPILDPHLAARLPLKTA
jgi:hypothetical protein